MLTLEAPDAPDALALCPFTDRPLRPGDTYHPTIQTRIDAIAKLRELGARLPVEVEDDDDAPPEPESTLLAEAVRAATKHMGPAATPIFDPVGQRLAIARAHAEVAAEESPDEALEALALPAPADSVADELAALGYRELQGVAKALDVAANGATDDLIQRILDERTAAEIRAVLVRL